MAKKRKLVNTDDSIDGVIASLKAQYPGMVFNASEYHMPWIMKRLPTKILDLDIAMHGGFPAGGLSFLVGFPGGCKSWLANQVIREQQILLGDACNIAWISTEMAYDKDFAQACGVACPLSSVELEIKKQDILYCGGAMSKEAEDAAVRSVGRFVTSPPRTAEKSLDIAIKYIESRMFHVVVIDSFGSLLTALETEKSFDEHGRVGGAALLNTSFSRKLNYALAPDKDGNPNLTCVIGINQLRDNMKANNKYSPQFSESGGWALKHARWVSVQLTKAGLIRDDTRKRTKIGRTIRWEITKQKAGGHEGASGTFDFLHTNIGIDRVAHSINIAAHYDVVDRSGSWLSYNGEALGQGATKAAQAVIEKNLLNKIEKETLIKAGVRCQYR